MTPEQARLIEEHGPRVRRILIAWARSVPQHCQEDAIADGMVGLVKAAESYNPSRGTSFPSYAITRAIGEAIDGLRRLDHLSRSERRRITSDDIDPPDRAPISIELGADSGNTISDQLAEPGTGPADHAEQHAVAAELYHAIRHLPPREQLVITAYYWQERTLRDIGEQLGVGESRASQLKKQAEQRLRASRHRLAA